MWLTKKKYISSGSLSQLAWRRFRNNRIASGSLIFIMLSFLLAISGYMVAPDNSPMSNEQNLVLTTRKPGFRIPILKVRKNERNDGTPVWSKILFGTRNQYTEIPYSDYRFTESTIIIHEYTGDSVRGQKMEFSLPDVIYPIKEGTVVSYHDSTTQFTTYSGNSLEISTPELKQQIIDEHLVFKTFLLGTDRYGRDVLSQLIIGTRVSLSVGFISVLISLLLGISLGALAGYFGGRIDSLILWLINVIWAVPTLLLVIAITFALGKGFWQVFIAVGLTMWVEVARVVRGQFLSLREKEFVEASKALGYKNFRIIFRHILPNALAPVIVISAANFASAILLEAGLSFLGIGVQPPMPSWGTMIRENYGYIILDYAYLAILPGIAIMLMVLAFMLVGNGLRDALDVRTTD